MPQLCNWEHLAQQVNIILCRTYHQVRPLKFCLFVCSPSSFDSISHSKKSGHPGRSIQLSSSLISVCPETKVCAVFSNRVFTTQLPTLSNGNSLYCFWKPLWPSWPTVNKVMSHTQIQDFTLRNVCLQQVALPLTYTE